MLITVGGCADRYHRLVSRAAARQPGAQTSQRKRCLYEVAVAVNVLNRMFSLGHPKYVRIA